MRMQRNSLSELIDAAIVKVWLRRAEVWQQVPAINMNAKTEFSDAPGLSVVSGYAGTPLSEFVALSGFMGKAA